MDLNQLVSKNQTIKIVPSTEEKIRAKGLNVNLDENTKIWFEQLKTTWKTWKRSPTVENHIELFFQCSPDPLRVALVFVIKCEEFKDVKPKSLPYFIMETLYKWTQVTKYVADEELKMPAFFTAIEQRNQHFLNLIVKAYQINTKKAVILPIVNEMIKSDNCKQASQIVIAMELFEDVPVEKLLFPLLLQDKNNMIDEYLTESPSQVRPLLYFLDSLLDRKSSIREYVQRYVEENAISHINYDKVHSKPIGKLIARLCNKFKIPIETCKNLSKYRTTGGLRYLIQQKYIVNNVSASVWEDLVKDSLKQNSESGKDFIDMLVEYDRKEALKWAEYLNIPEDYLPLALKDMSIQNPVLEEDWDKSLHSQSSDPEMFYQISLSDDQIILIDTAEKFYDLMMTNLVHSNVVSIDCEWKPSFGAAQSQVAVIQIATENNVYLIDTMVLNHQEYASFWHTFNKSFLDNAEIIKLGFGLEQDLKEMKASIVSLGNIKVKGEGFLDLHLLWKNLIDSGLVLSRNKDNGGNSLSSLVQVCFGLPLEKSEQCSNWELRPLRQTQIQYAALDAHVLIKIYYHIQDLCSNQGIDFEGICNDVMLEGKKKSSAKKVKGAEKLLTAINSNKMIMSHNIKFLVEPKLSRLLIYLRYWGVDATLMSSAMLWYDIIKIAMEENRKILLDKIKHTPTPKYPQTSILDVGSGTIIENLKKIIKNFNIQVEQKSVFSRCINCNSKNLRKLESSEVSDICSRYNESLQTNLNGQRWPYDDDEYDNVDNFLSDSECEDDYYQPGILVASSQSAPCVTSKGVPIEIDKVQNLATSKSPALLCESCGKLFWDEDELYKSVTDLDFSFINIIT